MRHLACKLCLVAAVAIGALAAASPAQAQILAGRRSVYVNYYTPVYTYTYPSYSTYYSPPVYYYTPAYTYTSSYYYSPGYTYSSYYYTPAYSSYYYTPGYYYTRPSYYYYRY
jgi:hypothetical protein